MKHRPDRDSAILGSDTTSSVRRSLDLADALDTQSPIRTYGSAERDLIKGSSAIDYVSGFASNDEMPGEAGGDALDGASAASMTEAAHLVRTGTSGDDVLTGSIGDDTMLGLGGDDKLRARDGDDHLDGGDGHDRLFGDDGADLIEGGLGNDRLYGGQGGDRLEGGAGEDWIFGQDGHDIAHGGDGNDHLIGNIGRDNLYGDDGDDELSGGDGADRLFGGTGDDDLDGGAGDDLIVGNEGHDIAHGGDGNDRMVGGSGGDNLYGEADHDTLIGEDGADRLFGGLGNDDLDGGAGMDQLVGNEGHDIIHGGDDDDRLFGNDGRDELYGDAGDDKLYGGNGADRLDGGDGRDTLDGGDANDVLLGGLGNDKLTGGLGNDTLNGGAGTDTAYYSGNYADYTVVISGATATVTGADGSDTLTSIERLQFDDQRVSLFLDPVSENPPVITSAASASVAENQTAAYSVTATDADGGLDTLTYALSGADAASFNIDSATGVVTFKAAPDYETPGDAGSDNVYDIVVSVTDGQFTDEKAVAITVTNENDNVPVITSGTSVSVAENQTAAFTAVATDGDGDVLSYALTGVDSALFVIDSATGVVSFSAAPDYEAPGDSGGNNVYDITVGAFDGVHTTYGNVAITVTDVNENGSDLPADPSTSASLELGGTYSNELEVVGDRDWIRVELVAGERYAISLDGTGGSPLSDPLVRLYSAAGTLVASNDDGGPNLNSLLSYTITTSGTYYVEAAAWDDSVAGGYTVGLETAPPLEFYTNDQIADFLETGYWAGNGQSARHWNVTEGGTITVNLVALTGDGRTLARAALELWSDLTGINFNEVNIGGSMVFDDDESGAFANTTVSGGIIQAANINISTAWLNSYGTNLDGYSFQTYIHEIGHALGLGHAGPYNGAADYAIDAAYLNDSWQASVMSYFSQNENTYVDASLAWVVSPQIGDILAIQDMYGLASTIRGGNTTYGFNSTAGNVIYDATSFTRITTYTIIDSGGIDTMDYSGSQANQTLDLREEHFSSLQGGTGNVGIARGTVIENAIGGSTHDILIGNDADNGLTGGGGNDTFYASAGSDVLNGGGGTDRVIFTGLAGDYTITVNGSGNTVLTDNRANSPDGVTELISIETIEYGGAAPDQLVIAPIPGGSTDLALIDPVGFIGLGADLPQFFETSPDGQGLIPAPLDGKHSPLFIPAISDIGSQPTLAGVRAELHEFKDLSIDALSVGKWDSRADGFIDLSDDRADQIVDLAGPALAESLLTDVGNDVLPPAEISGLGVALLTDHVAPVPGGQLLGETFVAQSDPGRPVWVEDAPLPTAAPDLNPGIDTPEGW